MELEFWGVRGSIASPGPSTARVGGNTSCVEVRCGETLLILDAGTGLRALGDALLARAKRGGSTRGVEAALLLSHFHWDHIQGLPFFAPAYLPTTRLEVVAGESGVLSLGEALAHQMCAPVFPVRLDQLGATLRYRDVRHAEAFEVGEARITAARLRHPGGVMAYRIDHGGASVVYATDTEHADAVDPALVALARGADVLVYDAQYTPEEYAGAAGPSRVGWGHSTFAEGAAVARAAGVGRLILFHHDPRRADPEVEAIESRARELFSETDAAREGMRVALSPSPRASAA